MEGRFKFCTNCGTPIQAPPPPKPTPPPQPALQIKSTEKLLGGLRAKLKVVEKTAGSAGQRARGVMSPERASEAVRNMLNVMTQVARDVMKDLPPDMVKAVDLEAEINLIAFSIGVSIDLEQLNTMNPTAPPGQKQQ